MRHHVRRAAEWDSDVQQRWLRIQLPRGLREVRHGLRRHELESRALRRLQSALCRGRGVRREDVHHLVPGGDGKLQQPVHQHDDERRALRNVRQCLSGARERHTHLLGRRLRRGLRRRVRALRRRMRAARRGPSALRHVRSGVQPGAERDRHLHDDWLRDRVQLRVHRLQRRLRRPPDGLRQLFDVRDGLHGRDGVHQWALPRGLPHWHHRLHGFVRRHRHGHVELRDVRHGVPRGGQRAPHVRWRHVRDGMRRAGHPVHERLRGRADERDQLRSMRSSLCDAQQRYRRLHERYLRLRLQRRLLALRRELRRYEYEQAALRHVRQQVHGPGHVHRRVLHLR